MFSKIFKTFIAVVLLSFALVPVSATDYFQVQVGYQAGVSHVLGDFAYGGALAGTENGAALDSLEIHLIDSPYESGIEYRVYTASGWSTWFSSWQTASNNNEAILGLEIQLKDFPHANVYYQTYRQGLGWSNWTENGGTSGTLDSANPITGFRVQVDEVGVEYISNVGGTVQSIRHNRETQGSGLIYTVQMGLISSDTEDLIEYRAHFMNSGWSEWSSNMAVVGSERSGDVITGLEARLVGLSSYHVGIQPQVDGVWWDWAYDGAMAGSYTTALTAYRVQIVRQVYVAPAPVVVVEEPAVIVGGGSTINTTPLTLDVDGDGFDDPFGSGTENVSWSNTQLVSPYRVTGLTVVEFSGADDQIPVIDTFNNSGDDAVNSSQYEVYLGTYVDNIFTITGGDFNSYSYLTDPVPTHTMILFDNEDSTVDGYTDVYPSGDPEHLNGIVMLGVYEEENDNGDGYWDIDDTDPEQNYLVWIAS